MRKGILRKRILEGQFRKGIAEGHFRKGIAEGHFRKGMKGTVHKLEFILLFKLQKNLARYIHPSGSNKSAGPPPKGLHYIGPLP